MRKKDVYEPARPLLPPPPPLLLQKHPHQRPQQQQCKRKKKKSNKKNRNHNKFCGRLTLPKATLIFFLFSTKDEDGKVEGNHRPE